MFAIRHLQVAPLAPLAPLASLVLLGLLAGCGNRDTTAPVIGTPLTTLNVSFATATLTPGQTTQASAVGQTDDGSAVAVSDLTWTSSNPAVASVANTGIVTALEPGAVTIRATSGSLTGAAPLTVQAQPSAPNLLVTLANSSITVGETTTASVSSAGNPPLDPSQVTWTSSVPTIATVSSAGVVTGLAPGTATIEATLNSNGTTASAPILVQTTP